METVIKCIDDEQIVDVVGYEGLYKISSFGYVISLGRTTRDGRPVKEKILQSIFGTLGYTQVTLSRNGQKKIVRVHQLVALHFTANPDNKPAVNHKDSIRSNNHVSNLEWCTLEENQYHARDFGKIKRGSELPQTILKEADVLAIREMHSKGERVGKLAEKYGVHHVTISNIIARKNWAHLNPLAA